MTTRARAVLVLGAYGLAGREITAGLVEKTGLQVVASGRDPSKLAALFPSADHDRLRSRVLDALDRAALTSACAEVDLVINCVGPYSMGGAEIARAVVESGVSYVDFANEQVHYRRLKRLDAVARAKGLILLTAAGAIPGISGVLMIHGAKQIPNVESIEAFYAQGRMPEPDTGLGSLMSGALEAGFQPVGLRNGIFVPARIGGKRRLEAMPAPLGAMEMIAVPTIEVLTIPERVHLRSIETYFAMGEVPPGFFLLMRLLKPDRRVWVYRFLRRVVAWNARRDYERSVRRGLGPEGIIKIVARGGKRCWEAIVTFRDGGIATAYLPVMVAKRLSEGRLGLAGLATAVDVFEQEDLWAEMARLGWELTLRTRVYEDDRA